MKYFLYTCYEGLMFQSKQIFCSYVRLCCFKMPKRKSTSNSTATKGSKKKKAANDHIVKQNNGDVKGKVSKSETEQLDVTNSLEKITTMTKDGRHFNLKITSWNVAGIRALIKKGKLDWLKTNDADIICLQECKCPEKDIPENLMSLKNHGYHLYWNESKATKGHSGVGLLSKVKPKQVDLGMGNEEHDQEGRIITAEFEEYYVVTTYVPNSQRKLVRLDYRMKWNEDFKQYLETLNANKPVILCGDMNVSHKEIDIANPKSNKRSAGFTQEERDGMTDFLNSGFVDSFRDLYPDLTGQYTFWTYMGNARARNVGWRLDYFIVSKQWMEHVCDNVIHSSVMGSDHCPISLLIAIP